MQASTATTAAAPHKPFYTHLYAQVLTAIVFGVLLGHFYPHLGEAMKPLGDGFIKLIKMLIAPIIFCTVVHGIASMEDMKKVGRVGLKALIYFEVTTTLALIVGLVVVNVLQPGVGMNVDAKSIDTKSIQAYTTKAGQQSTVDFLLHIVPNTVVGAFAEGEILQVLFFAILFAFALFMLGEHEQSKGEQDREKQDLQDLAFGKGADHRVRNDVEQEIHRALLAGLGRVGLNRLGVDRLGIDVHADPGL